jgi:hypothetical protein
MEFHSLSHSYKIIIRHSSSSLESIFNCDFKKGIIWFSSHCLVTWWSDCSRSIPPLVLTETCCPKWSANRSIVGSLLLKHFFSKLNYIFERYLLLLFSEFDCEIFSLSLQSIVIFAARSIESFRHSLFCDLLWLNMSWRFLSSRVRFSNRKYILISYCR